MELFWAYMKATAKSEQPLSLVERITVSFLMAGTANKTKGAGTKPAPTRSL